MKYLITCLVAAMLAGCEQPADTAATSDTVTGAADTSITATDNQIEAAPEAAAKTVPDARIIRAGLFKAVREGGLVEDPDTTTGKKLSSLTMEYVRSADRIPLVKGSYMGLQYRIFNLPPEYEQQPVMELRRVLIHPEMILPDGSRSTGSDYRIKRKIKIGQVVAHDAYGLHEDYELVEGDWIFQYWFGDHKLFEHTFTTYWPEEGDETGAGAENGQPEAEVEQPAEVPAADKSI